MAVEFPNSTEPFLTLKTRRFSIDGGRATLLEVECPELNFGMGIDVDKRGKARLIDDFLESIKEGVQKLADIDFSDPGTKPEVAEAAKRIHTATREGTPLAKLFKRP